MRSSAILEEMEIRAHAYDAIVVGSGLAGLAFALTAAEQGTICVLTKAEAKDANTSYAQGGIAAAVGEADTWELHEQDTLICGAGLCDEQAVRFLVQQAPDAIRWLRSLGANFDQSQLGTLDLGLEGGHSRSRIVHFQDRTGWEIERAMIAAVQAHPRIDVVEHAFVTRLLVEGGRCSGVVAELAHIGPNAFLGKCVLLATGGCGQLYSQTTNPRVATCDGIALAVEAGFGTQGMEFMQFHPTTLYHEQKKGFLITEAARGAGATLRNHRGRRFMYDYDPRLELAPRDIVSRSIVREMKQIDTWCVYLDLAHLPSQEVKNEFPSICAELAKLGIEIDKDWIPVVPAQHYSCGGIPTNLQGETMLEGLFAAGEVASTGVHGANRLASNSLLEAIVFARAAAEFSRTLPPRPTAKSLNYNPVHTISETAAIPIRKALQKLMTEQVGIIRSNAGLKVAQSQIGKLSEAYKNKSPAPFGAYAAETWNLLVAAAEVVSAALARGENVGLHFNADNEPND